MLTSTAILSASKKSFIRPLDKSRDLRIVADLIELCFADTLDEDGHRYLKNLRSTALSRNDLQTLFYDENLMMSGYVWENDGQVVGNLSIQPYTGVYYPFGHKVNLISNVAVHPNFRRQGIAKMLTTTALDDLQQRDNSPIWLHVRAENVAALSLYSSLGFVERFRRTTWLSNNTLPPSNPFWEKDSSMLIEERKNQDWYKQQAWFAETYPQEMWWYYAVTREALQPGLRSMFYRFFANLHLRQWSLIWHEQLIGVLGWQPTSYYADYLWLMVNETYEEQAQEGLFTYLLKRLGNQRPFSLDYPYQRANRALQHCGFHEHYTLVWMSLPQEEKTQNVV